MITLFSLSQTETNIYFKTKGGTIAKCKQIYHFASMIDDCHLINAMLILNFRSWLHFLIIFQEKLGFTAINYEPCDWSFCLYLGATYMFMGSFNWQQYFNINMHNLIQIFLYL